MDAEYKPDTWDPADEDWEQLFPSTDAKGELIPLPRKPPTSVGSAAAKAVDAVLDLLDSIGDSVRAWGTRGA